MRRGKVYDVGDVWGAAFGRGCVAGMRRGLGDDFARVSSDERDGERVIGERFRAATHRAGAVLSGYVHERKIPALFGDERVLAVGEQRGDRERERRSVSARGVDVVGAIRNVHVRIR